MTSSSTSPAPKVRCSPQQDLKLVIHRRDGRTEEVPVLCRIDTPIEVEYYRHGGILPYVPRALLDE